MMSSMATTVVTWSCSSRASLLRLHAEVFGQLLLDLLHPLAAHGRALDAEEISDILLHVHIIVVQRDGDVLEV